MSARFALRLRTGLVTSLLLLAACDAPPADPPPVDSATPNTAATFDATRVSRVDFNRYAAELYLPLFWRNDANKDGAISPEELAVLWGYGEGQRAHWAAETFTDVFKKAYDAIVKRASNRSTEAVLAPAEAKRQQLIVKELGQGRPTLVHSSFSGGSAADRAIVKHVLAAASVIEKIYAKQTGAASFAGQVPTDQAASQMVLFRNQGPWCAAPATEGDAACHATPSTAKRISGLYPEDIQADAKFCDGLKKHKNAEKLLHQFYVVRKEGDELKAVPYTDAYRAEMLAIKKELQAAAAAIDTPDEQAFKNYLLKAAEAFGNNDWGSADEAWAKMNATNSKWYLRIGPDEVYFEPCNRKAGFHVSFARINQDSLAWQRKLDPVKGDMEVALAKLAGKPYEARKVAFHLPDFIDIVLNAGDSRSAHGATVGQSLPNWGPVANEGRGRTVAMTNLYTDPDSKTELTKQAGSLLCGASMKHFTAEPEAQVMGIVLHEAAHNLGPAHQYKVQGKTAPQIFGGPRASMLEELKAQTAALYLVDWLADRKILDEKLAKQSHTRDITWTFGHISRGMYTPSGRPKAYSQLSAIQLGYLVEHGAIAWRADEKSALGTDTGCIEIYLDKFKPVVEKFMAITAGIKARGDKTKADELVAAYVDTEGPHKQLMATIRERWLRAPKASFVDAID